MLGPNPARAAGADGITRSPDSLIVPPADCISPHPLIVPSADCIMSDPGVPHHEANVPTQKATPAPCPRVSGPDGDGGRPERPEVSPAQGPQSAHPARSPVCVKRRARLVRRSEFDRALAGRASASSAYLALFVGNNGLGHPRVGLAVSRKLGNAVVRNRIKRRLRELVRPMAERTQAGR